MPRGLNFRAVMSTLSRNMNLPRQLTQVITSVTASMKITTPIPNEITKAG